MAEHAELIESAWTAYLTNFLVNAAKPWSAGLLIYPGENNLDKTGQRLVAFVRDMGEEDPPLSGNRWADVYLELRTPFSKAETLATHKANADALQTAVLNVLLPDALSAATGTFTCFGITDRTQTREQSEEYWSSGWKVRMLSCPSAIPA